MSSHEMIIQLSVNFQAALEAGEYLLARKINAKINQVIHYSTKIPVEVTA